MQNMIMLKFFACLSLLVLSSPLHAKSTQGYRSVDKAADAEIVKMEKSCLETGEKPTQKRQSGYKRAVDIGNGKWVFIVEGEKLKCVRPSMCGTGGCEITVISGISDDTKMIYSGQVRGLKIVRTKTLPPFFRLDLHGSNCGKTGAENCFKKLDLETGKLQDTK
jgi:hypothetical protein